jgi:nucleoside-diphosphate-sugar epimerase
MRHLVTGGSGFLGNRIARRLLERGDDVVVLDIWEDTTRPPEIAFVNCDITDREGVARAMRGIDVVHHNVALVPLTKAGNRFWDVNVVGSQIAAEEACKADVNAFVHMSSSAIYRAEHMPVTNATPSNPAEAYGKAKLAGERIVRKTCERAGLPLTVVRPRTILAPSRIGIFGILFKWIVENRKVYVMGDGNTLFQLVHAHDLMDAYMIATERGRPGDYNIGTDRFGTLRQVLENAIQYAGSSSKVVGLPMGPSVVTLALLDRLGLSPLAPWHYLTYGKEFYFDVEPLLALGWKPRYSNDEMMRESLDWWLEHGNEPGEETGSPHRKQVQEKILGLVRRFS